MKKRSFVPNRNIMSRQAFILAFIMIFNVFAALLPADIALANTDVPADTTAEISEYDAIVAEPLMEVSLPEVSHGGNILHAWNMSFNELIAQMPYIAAAGFNTIQTSPIGDSIFQFPHYHGGRPTSQADRSRIGTWWMLYQPRSFNIGNMLGTEAEFAELIQVADAHGVGIIVDAIPNHTTSWWYEIDESLRRPELFHSVPGDGGTWDRNISAWGDRWESRRARLLGLITFNTTSHEFQELYFEFLGRIIDHGVVGFRYDAMVHIELPAPFDPPGLASDFWPNIQQFVDERIIEQGRVPFQYGEILHRWQGDYIRALPGMLVTACGLGYHVRYNVINGNLGNWDVNNFTIFDHAGGYTGAVPSNFVTWVESHDTYGNDGGSRGITDAQMRVGWAIVTARAGTTPLFLVRPGSGFANDGQMFYRNADGTYTNLWGHSDFYRDTTIAETNWFANHFIDQPERTSTHFNQVALIERGPVGAKEGVVIVNSGTQSRNVDFPVQMVDGHYVDQVTGSIFTVANGRITGPALAGRSVAVIYGQTMRRIEPFVSATPGTTDFFDFDGIEVVLNAQNTTSQTYVLTGPGGAVLASGAYTDGYQLIIGAGASFGDEFTLTLTGTDGETTNTQTFVYTLPGEQSVPVEPGTRIEFVGPSAWSQARVWAWNASGNMAGPGASWGSAPQMTWDASVSAWVFIVPDTFPTPFNLIIHNGAGAQTPEWNITGSTRIYWTWGDGDLRPITPPTQPVEIDPNVWASPGTSSFFSEAGARVTLHSHHTTSRTFSVSGPDGELIPPMPFRNGDQIEFGAHASVGDQFTLTVTGIHEDVTVTETFTYTKADPNVRIEMVGVPWAQPRIWGWHPDEAAFFDSWDGAPAMVWEDAPVNAWVYTINANTHPRFSADAPFYVMFHNGAGLQVPARGAAYWQVHGDTRIEIAGDQPTFTDVIGPILPTNPTHEITFEVLSGNGTLTATVDGVTITSPASVEEGSDVIFTAIPTEGYRVAAWFVDGVLVEDHIAETFTLTDIPISTFVTVAFEAIPTPTCSVIAEGQFEVQEDEVEYFDRDDWSHWRICEDGTLEIDGGFIHWPRYLTPWADYSEEILQVVITGQVEAGPALRSLFSRLPNATEIEGLSYLDTSATTSMENMFRGSSSIVRLDLSVLDVSNVTNMTRMFTHTNSLRELTLGEGFAFIGENVGLPVISATEGYTGMWQNGEFVFTSAQLMNQFDGTRMSGTFVWQEATAPECEVIASGRFAHQPIAQGGVTGAAWQLCEDGTLEISEGFINWTLYSGPWQAYRTDITEIIITGPITAGASLRSLFRDMPYVTEIGGLTYFDTTLTRSMENMFRTSTGFTQLDLSNFDTRNVTNMHRMFTNTHALETVTFGPNFILADNAGLRDTVEVIAP